MIPSLHDILQQRHVARRYVRLFILLLVVCSSVPVTHWILTEILDEVRYWDGVEEVPYEHAIWMFAFLIPAVLIWKFEKRLLRWMVPMPVAECPRCGYSVRHLASTRCPECGQALPPSLMSEYEPNASRHPDQ